MKYGYVRVASQDEISIARQIETLKLQGAEEIIIEKSGKDLDTLLERLHSGDELYIVSIDRLTRDIEKASKMVDYIHKNNITLYVGGKLFELPIITLDKYIDNIFNK